MGNYQLIRRLEILIHLLRQYTYLPKSAILSRLLEDYDIDITTRTLERDFNALEKEFGIKIHYNRQENRYLLLEEDHERIANFLQFTGRIFIGDILREKLKNFKQLKSSITLEDNSRFEGLEYISPVLLAIQSKNKIAFTHYNYQHKRYTSYIITPLQLREYQRRWYVVGLPEKENHIKTFGLARVSKLENMGLSNPLPAEIYKQLEKFDHIIGLNYNEYGKAVIIELLVSEQQYNYLKSLPLHASQRKEEDLTNGWVRLSLYLIPNYELNMQILKMGREVVIEKPIWLREKIQNTLKETLNLYSDE